MLKKFLPLFLLPLLLVGCATSTITNLTPTHHPRNATGLYPVEMAIDSNQQTLRAETIQPQVIVDFEAYPMRPTLKMSNRWEALIPVPVQRNAVNYHFKVDYKYNRMGKPGEGSKLSPEYRLSIK